MMPYSDDWEDFVNKPFDWAPRIQEWRGEWRQERPPFTRESREEIEAMLAATPSRRVICSHCGAEVAIEDTTIHSRGHGR